MKKLSLLTLFALIAFISNAQIKRGDILLGGNVGFNTTSQTTEVQGASPQKSTNTSLTVNPSIGFAIQDNLVFGVDLLYTRIKQVPATTNTYGLGFFLRKYKYLGSGFSLFGQSRLGFGYSDLKASSDASIYNSSKEYDIAFGFYPGIAYAINKHWQIETGFPNIVDVDYNHMRTVQPELGQPDLHTTTNSFTIGSSLSNSYQFSVGLRYFIGS
jgi:hypothetical protein